MAQLQFLPWCFIERQIDLGNLSLLPFHRDFGSKDLTPLENAWVRLITAPYRNLTGLPVADIALVRHRGKELFDDLDEPQIDTCFELVELLAYSALANREYFTQAGRYCNFENFTMVGHRFKKDPARVTLETRRPDGRSLNSISLSDLVFAQPPHLRLSAPIEFDGTLLIALLRRRDAANGDGWGRWQNAITNFNRANTDSSQAQFQVEWTLLCGAIERLLDAQSKADDVATRFTSGVPVELEVPATVSFRRRATWRPSALRYQWMHEFYRVRGDFAHGKLETKQPMAWTPAEHRLLALIAIPLLSRKLLAAEGHYSFSYSDEIESLAFEPFLNSPIYRPFDNDAARRPPWKVCLDQARRFVEARKMRAAFEQVHTYRTRL